MAAKDSGALGAKSNYPSEVARLIADAVASGRKKVLTSYLMAHSNLPGPRGNLELAEAFERRVEQAAALAPEPLWRLCLELAATGPDWAPVNDPGEFVAFCGVRGVGAVAVAVPDHYADAMSHLRAAARDPRWRVREAVAMALQDLIASRGAQVLHDLEAWVEGEDWLAMRAVAAGIAEPRLLKDAALGRGALALHKMILTLLMGGGANKSDALRALRQCLGYSLSVVVAALPAEGWTYMRELTSTQNDQVRWIVRENLKKTRLIKTHLAEVQDVKACMQA